MKKWKFVALFVLFIVGRLCASLSHVRGRSKTVSKSSGKNGALKSNNNRGGERGATKRGSNGNDHIGKVNHIGIPY